jgi:O-Antigen ligase
MLDKLVVILFACGVLVIPFDDLKGIRALGELSPEASFYLFALALMLYAFKAVGTSLTGRSRQPVGASTVWWIGAVIVAVIFVSACWNLNDISVANFHDRGGFPKLVNCVAVIIYGLFLALLTCATVPGRWYRCLIRPLCIAAVICVSFGSLEALNRAGVNVPMYSTLHLAVHSGQEPGGRLLSTPYMERMATEGWDPRLRTVMFEPPAFGNFAGLVWPWLLAAVLITRKWQRAMHMMLLAAFTLLTIMSEARTAWLLVSVSLASLPLLVFLFLPRGGQVNKVATLMISSLLLFAGTSVVVTYAANYNGLLAQVVAGDSVSDLSRWAYQATALNIFAANPIFGSGLGQFAFHIPASMPSWGWRSPEIVAQLDYPEAPWPTTFSMYTRLASELGLVGLLGWIAIWSILIVQVWRAARIYANWGGTVPVITYPIIMGSIAILATGVSTDTFRDPMIWITLGSGVSFIARAKQLRAISLDGSIYLVQQTPQATLRSAGRRISESCPNGNDLRLNTLPGEVTRDPRVCHLGGG